MVNSWSVAEHAPSPLLIQHQGDMEGSRRRRGSREDERARKKRWSGEKWSYQFKKDDKAEKRMKHKGGGSRFHPVAGNINKLGELMSVSGGDEQGKHAMFSVPRRGRREEGARTNQQADSNVSQLIMWLISPGQKLDRHTALLLNLKGASAISRKHLNSQKLIRMRINQKRLRAKTESVFTLRADLFNLLIPQNMWRRT